MKRREYVKNLSAKDIKELNQELAKEQSKLADLRLDLGLGKQKNYSLLGEAKKNIARLHTLINDKAYAAIEAELLGTGEEK